MYSAHSTRWDSRIFEILYLVIFIFLFCDLAMAENVRRSASYDILNDEQKKILKDYYDRGMISTAASMRDVIQEAANQANITFERVKKWIGNEKQSRKRKASSHQDEELRLCPSKRRTTAYNLFCSHMLNSEECKQLSSNSERLKLAVDHWNLLGAEERVIWAERAKAVQSNDIHDLTVKQRTNQVKKGKKQLLSQVQLLLPTVHMYSIMI
ncbi:uncharacterized protein LOC124448340 [Xenia sp. Carnegie-2017]|uniref:uncharacterized protein LOC124448340 n=1 Tax=Xenia sp. Carnegie-2017 TaxID=2897299 RepID=UPI001F0426FC|nr:uncharacterized protein LOC124448340 [Xenia sp. Carnegie-2017]